jgi:hypothetical protein
MPNYVIGTIQKFETFILMLSGSTYSIWWFIVFLVFLQSYPHDRKSDENMLVINNM